jgi:hypothetical protein
VYQVVEMLMTSKEPAERFLTQLQTLAEKFNNLVTTANGDWVVKGFIDVFKNVYTISGDTKVISKVVELTLFPHFIEFAKDFGFKVVLAREQNHYPDLTFIDDGNKKFAVDLKSTYRTSGDTVSTMTLGAFTGYFRNRDSNKNITFPYREYSGHFVLGVIYSRAEIRVDELKVHQVGELGFGKSKSRKPTIRSLAEIPSVVTNLQFFAQPKYRIAKDQPGSGNTKNIGAVSSISALLNGNGPFAKLGEEVFDDYWMYYLTPDMARAVELSRPPYRNLATYLEYKKLTIRKQ